MPNRSPVHIRQWTGRGHEPRCGAKGFTVLTARADEVTCTDCRKAMNARPRDTAQSERAVT